MNVAFPFHLDASGRTATASDDDHIRQMLEELLFTRPGERVNRPTFGCGLLDLVFAPNSPELAAALNVTISAAVQEWLGDLIQLQAVDVASEDSKVMINLGYTVKTTGASAGATLSIPGAT